MHGYAGLALPGWGKRSSRNMLQRNGCERCGRVCAEMPVTPGHILNQRVNTTAPVENEVRSADAECSLFRDGRSSNGNFAFLN